VESTTQIFLRVQITDAEDDFVRGESLAVGYDDRIQIDSFSFGMEAKLQAPRAGKGANIDLNQVQVTKFFDRSSTTLAGLLQGKVDTAGKPTVNDVAFELRSHRCVVREPVVEHTRRRPVHRHLGNGSLQRLRHRRERENSGRSSGALGA